MTAHDLVLKYCRAQGGGVVMRSWLGRVKTKCVVFNLNERVPVPGSEWEMQDTLCCSPSKIVASGETWEEVAEVLGLTE